MITVTINGREIRTEPGKTVIEVALENGIYIPHFCWHPALSVSGNCRMCLVEVEKLPKQVIACSTYCTDGMVVHVDSEKAVQAREAVMEFILINHPLDCPICDEAGDCKLQEYAYRFSRGESRFDEEKNHKRKRVELGPHVVFDGERCISCSRCIRFCSEIIKDPQLTFVERGDRVTIETFPGETLDNPYSMNVIDLCPVGALTSKEFRFKARVWDMSQTETICPGCARGCNVVAWARKNEILRLTPRENPHVNQYWMCDRGRLESFQHVHADERLDGAMLRKNGSLEKDSWDTVYSTAAKELMKFKGSEVAFIGSAWATIEDNFLLVKFARDILSSTLIDFLPHTIEGDEDDFLIRADKTPNTSGALLVGAGSPGHEAKERIVDGIARGQVKALVVMDDDVAADPSFAAVLDKLEFLLVIASNTTATVGSAHVVFSSATWFEKLGAVVTFDRHLQLLRPAVVTAGNKRWMGGIGQSRLDRFGTTYDRWGQYIEHDARPSWQILTGIAQSIGAKWAYTHPEDVFEAAAAEVKELNGITYEKIGRRGVRLDQPVDEPAFIYDDIHP